MDRIPPLKAVRAFEATARHLSFSRAADELCVTQSAVSHQVRALEDFLGKKLLVRNGKQVSLTLEGDTFQSVVGDCFSRMASVTDHLTGKQKVSLRIMAQTSVASEWLVARMHDFNSAYPEVVTRLDTYVMAHSFDADDYDVLIGAWPAPEGFVTRKLNDGQWYPVCAPSVHKQIDPKDAASILQWPLYSTEEGADWTLWMQHLGLRPPTTLDIRHYNLALISARAAVDGFGIALSNDLVADRLMKVGDLIPLKQFSYSLPWGQYYVHYRSDRHNKNHTIAFTEWLEATARP